MTTKQAVIIIVLMCIASVCTGMLAVQIYWRHGLVKGICTAVAGAVLIWLTIMATVA